MKNLFMCLVAIMFLATAYADDTKTCRVYGTDGSVEVSVMVTDASTGRCVVSFSNDTNKNVNVRYVVKYGSKTLPGSKLVYANSEATKEVSFGQSVNPKYVEVSSLTGEKCQ